MAKKTTLNLEKTYTIVAWAKKVDCSRQKVRYYTNDKEADTFTLPDDDGNFHTGKVYDINGAVIIEDVTNC